MFHNLENGPVGNVYIPETKQGDWTGHVPCPRNSEVQWDCFLSFKENSAGHLHFAQGILDCLELPTSHVFSDGKRNLPFEHEWAFRFGATHQLLGDSNHITYARIYKTQAWVMIDEDSQGRPVWEKWQIRSVKPYWP
tara:strand:+ start:219 stop:629 length:411 start_codon:yes stop_codon:yes gene_type:complete